jgi:hypothetical protein
VNLKSKDKNLSRNEKDNLFAQSQLDILLKNDSSLAEQYQDTITEIRLSKEADYDRLKGIHDRFDYF